ncbi:hypothetical protein KIL84_022224 [Mauremys mutica]|uniref:Uncharacterized protein n=1 Tax=Mauremys mutica TaxID=74926 RepID=A0A9D3X899_9SAUR|nr:hypothetical protein KIL84_022224 [Mauremys mutica]
MFGIGNAYIMAFLQYRPKGFEYLDVQKVNFASESELSRPGEYGYGRIRKTKDFPKQRFFFLRPHCWFPKTMSVSAALGRSAGGDLGSAYLHIIFVIKLRKIKLHNLSCCPVYNCKFDASVQTALSRDYGK